MRKGKDIRGLARLLRCYLHKNLGGINNPALYHVCNFGTKKLVEDFHNEVIKCIRSIYYYQGHKMTQPEKLTFFSESRHSYGRTALLLSGGGTFGKFHYGVVKAMYD